MTEWHIITCEYPPQVGGVSDYTHLLASALAAAGDRVQVWYPAAACDPPPAPGVVVHRELGRFAPGDLRCAGKKLDRFPAPRRLLVQWVPHGYGYRSMNLYFCTWLWNRTAFHRDLVEVMVHEPFLSLARRSFKQNAAAAVHRVMTPILLRAASKVWVSIPAWEKLLRPYAFGRHVSFTWLPVPSNVLPVADSEGVAMARATFAPERGFLVGHFGAYGRPIGNSLIAVVGELLRTNPACTVLLLGRGSVVQRDELLRRHPSLAGRVHAAGGLAAPDLSGLLQACDLLIQPYPDGVSSRRGSVMAGLAHCLPIVTTFGQLTESFWSESNAVALAPVGDTRRMLQLAHSLLNDPAERARMGCAARRLYDARFDIKNVVQALRQSSDFSPRKNTEPTRAFSQP